ncbi:MAG TPA: response regulator, partial [Chthoniobacteraceae bacterium]|nr:response regulator [Chthoniobacteraceae bacterium]
GALSGGGSCGNDTFETALAREVQQHAGERFIILNDEQHLIIVEDDEPFARVLLDLARERGFKCIVATTAAAAERAVRRYKPAAITLDIHLPDRDGMALFDQWKHDKATRHIPVHIISSDAVDERGLRLGALGWLQKPVTREAVSAAMEHIGEFVRRSVRRLLVVEDNAAERQAIADLIGDGDVTTTAVGTATEALAALEAGAFDCAVVDLGLPDMPGLELIRRIRALPDGTMLPIIIHTGQPLSPLDEAELNRLGKSLIIKDARSPERLLDETALFLHRVQTKLPSAKRELIEKAHLSDPVLAGRTVLVVDDDVRNVYALTAALERLQMRVLPAENGREALEQLEREPNIDVVLMDVMMPEMDGFECTRRIRAEARWKNLPVIAVTAKAMKGSREQCVAAGASDYISKPVDMAQLRSLLRVWLYR